LPQPAVLGRRITSAIACSVVQAVEEPGIDRDRRGSASPDGWTLVDRATHALIGSDISCELEVALVVAGEPKIAPCRVHQHEVRDVDRSRHRVERIGRIERGVEALLLLRLESRRAGPARLHSAMKSAAGSAAATRRRWMVRRATATKLAPKIVSGRR
jgi:hypothetical protein